MSAVDRRIDLNKKRPAPPWVKMILLLAVVFGILVRSCWHKKQIEDILISDARVQEFTTASIDVVFTVENKTAVELERNVLIIVTTETGEELASRITSVILLPNSKRTHLKVLQKLNRPVLSASDVANVTVELYVPSIF